MSVRTPSAAGTFYPRRPQELREAVESCLSEHEHAEALAAVVPHAGYRYSGPVAGAVYARVSIPRDVVLLAFHHRGAGAPVAVWTEGSWTTPLGEVPVNADLAKRIAGSCPGAVADERGHLEEHSAEVQLPFLQVLRPDVRVVPVALSVGLEDAAALAVFGRSLARVISEELVVCSTDLNHYADHEKTMEQDRRVIEPMERLDEQGLVGAIREHRVSMCGFAPAIATIAYAKARGAKRAVTVAHRTSGDATGERERCVGYVGMIVRKS